MQFVSSDTNVWLDFVTIQKMEFPFRLPYTYIMSRDAVNDELLSPPGLGQKLTSYGLVSVDIFTDKCLFAGLYGFRYTKPSINDCGALALGEI